MTAHRMRPTEFYAILEKGQLGPVYFFKGPDGFLHEECRAAAMASLPAETREWCLTESSFKPGQLRQDLENAYQMPMLGGHSFFYLSDDDDFEHAVDEDVEALDAYLKSPPPFSTLFFAAREPDRRRRFIQLLEKKASAVEMTPLSRREAAAWLQNYLKKAGIDIQPALAEAAVARFEASPSSRGKEPSGVNLLWLRTEIEKLLVTRLGLRRVEEADLALISGPREEHEIGKLLAAVAGRKLSESLVLLQDLLTSKEPETLVLWCLGDLFRQALKSSSTPARYAPWSRSVNPYSTFEIAPRVHQAYSREEIARALRMVRAADLAVKSSWKDSKLILETLLWQVMTGKDGITLSTSEAGPVPAFDT